MNTPDPVVKKSLTTDTPEMNELIGDIFARACNNNEYFGNDGWYELHTPTLRQEIEQLIVYEKISLLEHLMTSNPKYTYEAAKDILIDLKGGKK